MMQISAHTVIVNICYYNSNIKTKTFYWTKKKNRTTKISSTLFALLWLFIVICKFNKKKMI